MADATFVGGQTSAPTTFIGAYTGTGAALTVSLGFQPNAMIMWKRSGTRKLIFWSSASETTLVTMDTEAATESVAVAKSADGFLLGTDSTVNESGVVFDFIAFR